MDKATLFAKRKEFFEEILTHLQRAPTKVDELLSQDKYHIYPDMENTLSNPEYGDVAISIKGEFFGQKFNVYYTLWQLGDILKIGVALYDEEIQGAFTSDSHNEVFYIWGNKNDPRIDVAHGCVFYDWEFDVPNLYNNYKHQERFILGVRHMHFRVMRIIYDECERIYYQKNKKDDDLLSSKGISSVDDFDKYIQNGNFDD